VNQETHGDAEEMRHALLQRQHGVTECRASVSLYVVNEQHESIPLATLLECCPMHDAVDRIKGEESGRFGSCRRVPFQLQYAKL
jgi:hypothetical protein